MEDTIRINELKEVSVGRAKGIEIKYTGSNGDFTQRVVDNEIKAILTNAFTGNLPCLITLEKTNWKGEPSDFWNIKTAEVVIGQMNKEETTTSSPEIVEKPIQQPKPSNQSYNDGAARGMTVKEIGDLMREGLLSKIFGKKIASNLVDWYQTQIIGITGIAHDGKDLPTFKEE